MPEIDFHRKARGILSVLLLTGFVLGGCGDTGETITRLTVGSAGPDPYTLMSGTDRQKIKKSPRGGGTADGDSPGLYGGTRRAASCDPAKLVRFLQGDPGKARAWAGAVKIAAADIPRFVGRLTPVLLRADTLVTNHGYKGGEATAVPAVLQAGMGVLVNEYGVPVVKCNCGNPLTPPGKKIFTGKAKYRGSSWPGFDRRKVTKIRERTVVTGFVLVDPDATIGFRRPAATTGREDGPPTAVPPVRAPVPGDSGSADPSTSPGDPDPSGVPSGVPGSEPPADGGSPAPGTTGDQPGPEQPGEPGEEPGGDAPDGDAPQPPESLGPPEARPREPISS